MSKLRIKKSDIVFVNADEDKGKTGHVLRALVKDNRVTVEDINVVSKRTKLNTKNPQGRIEKKGTPIRLSNLNVANPESGKATRINRELNEKDALVHCSKKSGEEIK